MYFGLIQAGLQNYKWLNLIALSSRLLKPSQKLIEVKYFTSRVSNDPDKQKRQGTYIEALETSGVRIFHGHYQSKVSECKRCGARWPTYSEKMTDVNIATEMLVDAYQDLYDMAMLISGDSDLVPPMRAIHSNFDGKRVFVAFPPKRQNQSVAQESRGSLVIGRKNIILSQFPSQIMKPDGYTLNKPMGW